MFGKGYKYYDNPLQNVEIYTFASVLYEFPERLYEINK